MWVVLALSLTALGFSVLGAILSAILRHAFVPAIFAGLVALLGVGCLGAGFVFRAAGLARVERALVHADPQVREGIRAAGRREAAAPLAFGVVASVPPLMGAAALGLVAISRYRKGQA